MVCVPVHRRGGMRIASGKFEDKYETEKCPSHTCLMIRQNWLVVDENTLGCLRCGNIFLTKAFRDSLDVRALLESQNKQFKCEVCDRVFEKKIALLGHMRGKCGQGEGKTDDQ